MKNSKFYIYAFALIFILSSCAIGRDSLMIKIKNNSSDKVYKFEGTPRGLSKCFMKKEKRRFKDYAKKSSKQYGTTMHLRPIAWETNHNDDFSVVTVGVAEHNILALNYAHMVVFTKNNEKMTTIEVYRDGNFIIGMNPLESIEECGKNTNLMKSLKPSEYIEFVKNIAKAYVFS